MNAISTEDSKYQTAIHASRLIEIPRKLVNFTRSEIDIRRIQLVFSPILEPGTRSAMPLPKCEQLSWLKLLLQSNSPAGRPGEARQSGNSDVTADLAVLSR